MAQLQPVQALERASASLSSGQAARMSTGNASQLSQRSERLISPSRHIDQDRIVPLTADSRPEPQQTEESANEKSTPRDTTRLVVKKRRRLRSVKKLFRTSAQRKAAADQASGLQDPKWRRAHRCFDCFDERTVTPLDDFLAKPTFCPLGKDEQGNLLIPLWNTKRLAEEKAAQATLPLNPLPQSEDDPSIPGEPEPSAPTAPSPAPFLPSANLDETKQASTSPISASEDTETSIDDHGRGKKYIATSLSDLSLSGTNSDDLCSATAANAYSLTLGAQIRLFKLTPLTGLDQFEDSDNDGQRYRARTICENLLRARIDLNRLIALWYPASNYFSAHPVLQLACQGWVVDGTARKLAVLMRTATSRHAQCAQAVDELEDDGANLQPLYSTAGRGRASARAQSYGYFQTWEQFQRRLLIIEQPDVDALADQLSAFAKKLEDITEPKEASDAEKQEDKKAPETASIPASNVTASPELPVSEEQRIDSVQARLSLPQIAKDMRIQEPLPSSVSKPAPTAVKQRTNYSQSAKVVMKKKEDACSRPPLPDPWTKPMHHWSKIRESRQSSLEEAKTSIPSASYLTKSSGLTAARVSKPSSSSLPIRAKAPVQSSSSSSSTPGLRSDTVRTGTVPSFRPTPSPASNLRSRSSPTKLRRPASYMTPTSSSVARSALLVKPTNRRSTIAKGPSRAKIAVTPAKRKKTSSVSPPTPASPHEEPANESSQESATVPPPQLGNPVPKPSQESAAATASGKPEPSSLLPPAPPLSVKAELHTAKRSILTSGIPKRVSNNTTARSGSTSTSTPGGASAPVPGKRKTSYASPSLPRPASQRQASTRQEMPGTSSTLPTSSTRESRQGLASTAKSSHDKSRMERQQQQEEPSPTDHASSSPAAPRCPPTPYASSSLPRPTRTSASSTLRQVPRRYSTSNIEQFSSAAPQHYARRNSAFSLLKAVRRESGVDHSAQDTLYETGDEGDDEQETQERCEALSADRTAVDGNGERESVDDRDVDRLLETEERIYIDEDGRKWKDV